jgi:hypothetical protein
MYYGYIPIIIYPFVNNVNELFMQLVERGVVDGRFLQFGGKFGFININQNLLKKIMIE